MLVGISSFSQYRQEFVKPSQLPINLARKFEAVHELQRLGPFD
jgi:hypothetical protein